MSALTELRKRITTPDGHLVDRNKIDVELGKAIAAEEAYETISLSQARIALKLAEEYLVARGIEHRGTVGRTIVLPKIREALIALKSHDCTTCEIAGGECTKGCEYDEEARP